MSPTNRTGPLSESQRDEVARDAARLLRDGRAASVADAVRAALRGGGGAEQVSVARVRDHARGLAMEALGAQGYEAHVASVLARAEETMTLLATQLATAAGEPPVVLVGRAANAQIDADPCCRIRVQTHEPIGILAAVLVDAGMEEPSFAIVETRFGRLDQLLLDDAGVDTRILRIPPTMRLPLNADLRQDRTVPTLSLEGVRGLLASLGAG